MYPVTWSVQIVVICNLREVVVQFNVRNFLLVPGGRGVGGREGERMQEPGKTAVS